jgi:hypothetical protein
MPKSQTAAGEAQQQIPEDTPAGNPRDGDGGGNADNKNVKPEKTRKLNLVRFLQEKPQDSGIRALLNAKYRTAVKSMDEWEIALKDLLGKKIK